MKPTNWHVITGAPCSGKTAVICELERRGYVVVHEVARAHIDAEMRKGRSLKQIKADLPAFERHILSAKIKIEKELDPAALVFLDRAVPDSIAYYQLAGLDMTEAWEASQAFRYRKIFLLEKIQFKPDAVRSENKRVAEELDRLLEAAYQRLGHTPIRVPLMSIAERVNFILEKT